MTLRAILLLVLAAFSPACRLDCKEEACAATEAPRGSRKIAQGVTGVVAYRTDACVEGCCECSWDQAELGLWHSELPVDEAQARALVASDMPALRFSANRSYEQELEPGHYLLCQVVPWGKTPCATLHIEQGQVFTVNLQQRYGPPSLIVFAPGDRNVRDDLVFTVDNMP